LNIVAQNKFCALMGVVSNNTLKHTADTMIRYRMAASTDKVLPMLHLHSHHLHNWCPYIVNIIQYGLISHQHTYDKAIQPPPGNNFSSSGIYYLNDCTVQIARARRPSTSDLATSGGLKA
jgi:hypothetical protein